jgi:L-2-hydroxycarboxylate dehydrogenase (NAD+)
MNDVASKSDLRFAAAEGRDFMSRAFVAAGLPQADAGEVADLMLMADLRGIDSHGIVRLTGYIKRILAGGVNRTPNIHVVQEAAATALVDGDNGMGHLVMRHAARIAIAKAEKAGIAWVGTRASNHAGAASVYAMMPLAHDMVGLYLAVANNNHMAPWGGIEAMLGTNPIAIAIPTKDEAPIVLDIATTAISFGKIRMAADNNEKLPEGFVIDHAGNPVTDPNKAEEGLLLPMGGYKGSGLSLVFALLGAAMNGVPVGREAASNQRADRQADTGQAIMAIKLANFGPVDAFKQRTDTVARDIRNSKPLPGVSHVRYPGQQGHATMLERRRSGVPIRKPLIASLNKLAADLRIVPLALI